jgi:hypothetical protein
MDLITLPASTTSDLVLPFPCFPKLWMSLYSKRCPEILYGYMPATEYLLLIYRKVHTNAAFEIYTEGIQMEPSNDHHHDQPNTHPEIYVSFPRLFEHFLAVLLISRQFQSLISASHETVLLDEKYTILRTTCSVILQNFHICLDSTHRRSLVTMFESLKRLDIIQPKLSIFGVPRSCHGLTDRNGKTRPMVSGSNMSIGQHSLPAPITRTKSHALFKCLCHWGVSNRGHKDTWVQSHLLLMCYLIPLLLHLKLLVGVPK